VYCKEKQQRARLFTKQALGFRRLFCEFFPARVITSQLVPVQLAVLLLFSAHSPRVVGFEIKKGFLTPIRIIETIIQNGGEIPWKQLPYR
jgi:hypothetical protein